MPAGKIIIYIVGFSKLNFPIFRKIASCIYQVNIKRAEGHRSASEDIYHKKGADKEERRKEECREHQPDLAITQAILSDNISRLDSF